MIRTSLNQHLVICKDGGVRQALSITVADLREIVGKREDKAGVAG